MVFVNQVISTARTCNCILIVLDAIKPITHKRLIEKELEGFGIRYRVKYLSSFIVLHLNFFQGGVFYNGK